MVGIFVWRMIEFISINIKLISEQYFGGPQLVL